MVGYNVCRTVKEKAQSASTERSAPLQALHHISRLARGGFCVFAYSSFRASGSAKTEKTGRQKYNQALRTGAGAKAGETTPTVALPSDLHRCLGSCVQDWLQRTLP